MPAIKPILAVQYCHRPISCCYCSVRHSLAPPSPSTVLLCAPLLPLISFRGDSQSDHTQSEREIRPVFSSPTFCTSARPQADMVKLSFNSTLSQKDGKKEDENNEVLIIPEAKEPEDIVPLGQRRAWCWCMCFGLAFMLAGIVLGGAYLYKYFAMQRGVYFCGIRYLEDDAALTEPYAETPVRYHSFKESIQILEEEDVELINVPVPEFADNDPVDIVHDFHRKLTAYLDLNLNKCYVIPLNTSIVMPPKNFLELLLNIKAGTYLPQSYLVHEQMIVTDRIENVDQLGFFIYRLCRDKETYKLQRKETIRGFQKREAENCHTIRHFANRFAVETQICEH